MPGPHFFKSDPNYFQDQIETEVQSADWKLFTLLLTNRNNKKDIYALCMELLNLAEELSTPV